MNSVVDLSWISRDTGIPLSTMHHYNRTGVGPPSYKVGRRYWVRRSDYEIWLAGLQGLESPSENETVQSELEEL